MIKTKKSLFTLCLLLLVTVVSAQRADVSPDGTANYLPVEGCSLKINIDTTSRLDSLVERLNNNWRFRETGKLYWIGYTDDMFSIAAWKDSAIDLLSGLIDSSDNPNAVYGAIYTLHLIGINSTIKGRMYEVFTNRKARRALLRALKHPELQPEIMRLLIRDPKLSDIPPLMEIVLKDSLDSWPIINFLTLYSLQIPYNQDIPKNFEKVFVEIDYTNEIKENFELELNEILCAIDKLQHDKIIIDKKLLNTDLWGPLRSGLIHSGDEFAVARVNIRSFLYEITDIEYTSIGNKIQYFVDGNKIYICTPSTAKKRLIEWWNSLTLTEKEAFNSDKSFRMGPGPRSLFRK